MNQEYISEISSFIKDRNIMTLATSNNEVWACTVYYGIDDDLNLYFVSPPTSRHAQHIAASNQVAFAIFDSNQPVSTKAKQGVYGMGECTVLKGISELTRGLKIWNASHKLKVDTIPLKELLEKAISSKVYVIKPTKLKMFGAKNGDEKEIEVDL